MAANEQGSTTYRSVGPPEIVERATSEARTAFASYLLPLRSAYRDRIERLAERLRPWFERGKLHGYRGEDDAIYVGSYSPKKFAAEQAKARMIPIYCFERALCIGMVPTDADAYLVLACSRWEKRLDPGALRSPRAAAGECMAKDVLAIAFARGWYEPWPEECPSAGELLGCNMPEGLS